MINRYGPIEKFPDDVLRNTDEVNKRELALLFKDLATLRTDIPLFKSVEQLRWQKPLSSFESMAEKIGEPRLADRINKLLKV